MSVESIFCDIPTLSIEPTTSASYKFQLHVYANSRPHRVAYLMRTADQFERLLYCIGENVDGSELCCLSGAVPFEMMAFRDYIHKFRYDAKRPVWRTHVAHGCHETDFQILEQKSNRVMHTLRVHNDTGHMDGIDPALQAQARAHMSMGMVATIVFSGRLTSDEALGPWLDALHEGVISKFSV